MNIGAVLFILLILILVGVFPAWPYSAGWGHGPVSVVGILLIILIVLLLTGRL
jgi:hypothetical protein